MSQPALAFCFALLGIEGVVVEPQEPKPALNPFTNFLLECEIPVLRRLCKWDDAEAIDFRVRATHQLKDVRSPRSLRNQLLAVLRAENPRSPGEAAYAADVKLRDDILRDATVHMFVANVDKLVGLTSKQVPTMIEVGRKLYEQKKLPYPTTHGLGKVVTEDLEAVLSVEQQKFFNPTMLTPEWVFQFIYLEPVAEPIKAKAERRARMHQRLRAIAEMKSNWLTAELELSKTQAKRIAIAAKSGISKAITAQFEAQAKLQLAISNGKGRSVAFEVAEASSTDMISLYNAKADWLDVVRGQLTVEEKAKLETTCANLRKRRATAFAYFTLFHLQDGNQFRLQVGKPLLSFTDEQQLAIQRVVSDQLSKSTFANKWLASGYAGKYLQTIDRTKLVAVMGPENARRFKPPAEPVGDNDR